MLQRVQELAQACDRSQLQPALKTMLSCAGRALHHSQSGLLLSILRESGTSGIFRTFHALTLSQARFWLFCC